jgi:predicted esterase
VTDTASRARSRRAALPILLLVVLAGVVYRRFSVRPSLLQLATSIDGAALHRATTVIVFLHGRGGGLGRSVMARRLREAGLPANAAVVSVEGPYATWLGHQWGDAPEEQAVSRARLRALLSEIVGAGGPPSRRIVVAGFSQGAGVALDLAVEDERIGAVASFSPCASVLRGRLPQRNGMRTLLVHGRADTVCPVEESRSLWRVLESAAQPVQYLELEGGHVMPDVAVRRLVSFATEP